MVEGSGSHPFQQSWGLNLGSMNWMSPLPAQLPCEMSVAVCYPL